MKPSAPYLGLLLASCGKLEKFLKTGCQLSPRASYDFDDEDDEVTQSFTSANHQDLSVSEDDK